MGKVYLVGAGPGSIDLLTRKAECLLRKADCIVYDRLIEDAILDLAMDDCEMIYVGKQAGNHTMKQDAICNLLVEKAKQYDCVVRLKGGDVYVFGRGGEEGIKLYENHIPFEVYIYNQEPVVLFVRLMLLSVRQEIILSVFLPKLLQ